MKKMLFIFIFSLFFFLTGCVEDYNGKVYYFESYGEKIDSSEEIFVISSKDMLIEYSITENDGELNELIDSFSDDFFVDKSLVIIYLMETSGSNSLKLKSFSINDNIIKIKVKRFIPGPNEAGTCDILYHHIVVEVAKENVLSITDYQLEIIE